SRPASTGSVVAGRVSTAGKLPSRTAKATAESTSATPDLFEFRHCGRFAFVELAVAVAIVGFEPCSVASSSFVVIQLAVAVGVILLHHLGAELFIVRLHRGLLF